MSSSSLLSTWIHSAQMVNKSVIVSNFERGTDGASLEVIRLQDADYQLPAQQHCNAVY